MAVKIRLQRHGKKNFAFFHIVVADSRAPRDGRFIEQLGSYNPNTNPATIVLDAERALAWLNVGAQPTLTKTATLQTPRFAQPGEDGVEGWFILELKLLADVGLVGFPNAGKSTLLATITSAKPKIANYAFTTLEPNLGIVKYYDDRSFVMADIPGIIEGAHEGRGIGIRFLRHIERNSVLLFMVSAEEEDIAAGYCTLLNELEEYNPELLVKDRVLAVTKCDLIDKAAEKKIEPTLPADIPHVFISSMSQEGLKELKEALWKALHK